MCGSGIPGFELSMNSFKWQKFVKNICSIDLCSFFSETYVKMSLSRKPMAMETVLKEDHSEVQSHMDCSGDAKIKVEYRLGSRAIFVITQPKLYPQ